jgi:hypothetical protein
VLGTSTSISIFSGHALIMSCVDSFQEMPKWNEAGDVLDVPGTQQLVDHVKNEQRLHPVVREPLPSFCERDVAEAAWMPDETAILSFLHGRRVLRRAHLGKLFALNARFVSAANFC